MDTVPKSMIPAQPCEGSICNYMFNVPCPVCSSSTDFNVTVSASNKIGEGQPSDAVTVGIHKFSNLIYSVSARGDIRKKKVVVLVVKKRGACVRPVKFNITIEGPSLDSVNKINSRCHIGL